MSAFAQPPSSPSDAHKMDQVDEIKLLEFVVNASNNICASDKAAFLSNMGEYKHRLEQLEAVDEDQKKAIQATLDSIKVMLEQHHLDMINPLKWTGVVPPALQIHGVPGAVPIEKLLAQPAFKLRGHNYLNDWKKVRTNYYNYYFQYYLYTVQLFKIYS